ncbi:MAG: aldehyde dehydrogenase family protein [Nitrospira sp.]|nr:aldehyde dehydrogenase family protein [Nitrospira sp.]
MATLSPLLLGSEWRETSTRRSVTSPFTGEAVADVCLAQPEHIEEAMTLSLCAYPGLARTPAHIRATALHHIADRLKAQQEDFARTICMESGKPIADARREVGRAIQTFSIASEEAKRMQGEIIPMDSSPGMEHHHGLWQRVPIGPVLGITPFNFPLNLVAHKVAPCLAAGNPMILKPAPQTPLTALRLGTIFQELDLPNGTLSILPCENTLAESMVRDARIRALSFTGSAAVGWRLKEHAGKKRVVLELGGNAAVIIEPDANLDMAAARCLTGGFSYSGQTCISVQRMYIHDEVYESFLKRFIPLVEALPTGNPADESTVIGPLISEQAADRVETLIREAVRQGAQLVTGGTREQLVIHPTVLAGVRPDMRILCEEAFGPIITLSRYQRLEQALDMVNDSAYGLQAGIFTHNINSIFHAYHTLDVGAVLANEIPTFRADHMPYGGVKDSGLGREGVKYAIQELTEPKLLVLHLPR